LTDVDGVQEGQRTLAAVACDEIERLVKSKVVSGGMVLKLEAARRALEGGVQSVHIVGGTLPGALLAAVEAAGAASFGEAPGTRVLREALPASVPEALSAA